ncbi:MAG: ABC transporter permease [Bacteroidales bacterium]
MNQFSSFVRKEFCHILRDKRTLLILLVMPVVEIILFGFAISTDVRNIRLGILDPSNDVATRSIIQDMDASKYFTVNLVLHTPEEIEDAFRKNKIDMVIVFEDKFYERVTHEGSASVQLLADGTNPNTANIGVGYATNIIMAYQMRLAQKSAFSGASSTTIRIVPNIKMLYNPQMKAAYTFVPGVMGMILMLICSVMTSIAIVREKERGTMEVLLVSPVKPISIILSKTVPYLVISIVNMITIFLLSIFVLKVPVSGSMAWLIIVSILFIFVSLSLGMLISSIVKTQVAAMLFSGIGMMLPGMLLSGLMFPIENMPLLLQWISYMVPAKWYITAVKCIMIQGLDISYCLTELYVLLGMAVLFIFISLKRFKYRLE